MGGFTAALQKFGIGRLAAVLGVAAGVAAVLVAVMLRVGQAPDALLYSNLDLREASEISAALDQAGIKYSSKGDGSTIFVSRDEVGTARLMLAGKGLVTSGSVGYEIFDNQSVLGQTEFQQNLNEQRALQGELSRTIMSMRGITSARVHITMPRREMFQAAATDPTAAVVVGVGGRDLSGDQVRAIRNVVASSVPNLKPDKVTVTDQSNRTLAAGSEDTGFTSANAEAAKATTESQLQTRIKDIVEGVVGAGAARVQVTADIDHSRSTTQEQKFDPDGQVVRSTSTNGSQSQDTTGQADGGVTATNNIPGGAAPNTTPVGSTNSENTETTNYEISNTTTTTVKEPGEVKKLSVSVAVDGKYTPAADGKGEPTYAPRTAEEVQQIKTLVAAAVGIDETRGDKIEVVNVRFNREPSAAPGADEGSSMFNFDKNDIMRGVELLVLVITGFLLIFFVVRPLLKAATGGATTPALVGANGLPVTPLDTQLVGGVLPGQPQMLAGPSEMDQRLDIARIEGQVKASSIKKVADFVDTHPEESTAILRSWVHES
ncbi:MULTISPECIES: flagellar basal-body MS-ring/collar protein FliF [unclassified Brevundimonas]|uniref:flagellar basal-body MS-ring/collar protein FliF n=1 Tax=unclassified Brevundimonas TaxID=2622653 RepID=UPI000CFD134F|nr:MULTISPECIES: flagellar basal-body MS-ring/collar protein FliF [unclassified Brevundimonas]PRA30003.1 flagellar M-ring protein FliF [Brevundimonas sp. MYb27]PQZ80839.1 flagellar M-ring protein FliF [Brevundimonas sp. MYb31]PRB14060.1 flagellar M-ring protein FliF [Brevundimonas sp. MYb52]PRB33325.1 flagellar M-ring protein FliF [Brevundimonas sp. MYb46]PRB50817.1 flagellar M-ring protein FliF [Brevundimonas sp. MYb33]